MLPLLYSEGVVKRKLRLPLLVRMLSYAPSRLFGLYPRKGALQLGSDADIVIFDSHQKSVIEREGLFYKNKHSSFIGMAITGAVASMLLGGKLVYQKGEIVAPPGTGGNISAPPIFQRG